MDDGVNENGIRPYNPRKVLTVLYERRYAVMNYSYPNVIAPTGGTRC